MKNKRFVIYLIDLAYESKFGRSSDWMPLQLGQIASYCLEANQADADRIDIEVFKSQDDLKQALEACVPDVVGGSNFSWNSNLNYGYLKAIKQANPGVITIMGGPNYPDPDCGDISEQVTWLKTHPYLDFHIYKDGWTPFASLIEFLLENKDVTAAKRATLSSCHSLEGETPCFGDLAPRIKELDDIPSPYTHPRGFMKKFFEQGYFPVIQGTHGCPFKCTFCVEGIEFYKLVAKLSQVRKEEDINYIVEHLNPQVAKMLFVTDSNFGMFKEDVEYSKFLGEIQRKVGFPEYIGCTAGKERKDLMDECNSMVNGGIRYTLAAQSMDQGVLKVVQRENKSMEKHIDMIRHVADSDTNSVAELIQNLPTSTREIEFDNFRILIDKYDVGNITQYPLTLLMSTEMNFLESRGGHGVETKFRPIQRCVQECKLNGSSFLAVDDEELCVATSTMSFEAMLEVRHLYLTVGLFYNDRVFSEINSLLRFLGLSTYDWLHLIFQHRDELPDEIRYQYEAFNQEFASELWPTREDMLSDIDENLDDFLSRDSGNHLIYRCRAQAVMQNFQLLHQVAYQYLRQYLDLYEVQREDVVADIERFSLLQKQDLLDLAADQTQVFSYDLVRMIYDPVFRDSGATLSDIHYQTTVRFYHSEAKKSKLKSWYGNYKDSDDDWAMLFSRFPVKQLYRTAEVTLKAIESEVAQVATLA